MMKKVELLIAAQERDLGGFHVRRILPSLSRRMVGPFLFFDHMGPAEFGPGEGMDVRPHPHVHLATVTYLFEGVIQHRDSLGSDQLIEPGAINWMIAGKGIVHSERTPIGIREKGDRLNGIQCWIALPDEKEDIDPSFEHHPAHVLPQFQVGASQAKLLLGSAFGRNSPVSVHSNLFYLDVKMPKGEYLKFPAEGRESAVYVASGGVRIEGDEVPAGVMAVIRDGEDFAIESVSDTRLILLGGMPVGRRFIYWNFVGSTKDRLESAKSDWRKGPGEPGSRFPRVPGDEADFIPLPGED